ncbi:hypothetical protein BZB76_2514 [Actinomadura pelletieri DSM 43383]|uniref:Uncharacterized protein n=1 Tax=Actinomadura pelletieri DSM 43383 TaxID=1120940 RepID=A0A495QUG4_9ACTN|nr:hypothetical protein BZB76_2514 [Actinomadura pelletieri DSM 43383]
MSGTGPDTGPDTGLDKGLDKGAARVPGAGTRAAWGLVRNRQ